MSITTKVPISKSSRQHVSLKPKIYFYSDFLRCLSFDSLSSHVSEKKYVGNRLILILNRIYTGQGQADNVEWNKMWHLLPIIFANIIPHGSFYQLSYNDSLHNS